MRDIDEGHGTLLDNSVVLFGSGMKDGNVHEPVDIPIAMFGQAGEKFQTNRLIACPSDSIVAQLHLSLLQTFGIEADSFNGATSKVISELL